MLEALNGAKQVIAKSAHLLMIDENESYSPKEPIFDVVRTYICIPSFADDC